MITDFGALDEATGAVVQCDGKLVVAGFTSTYTSASIALARYDTNGTLDPTFGTGGKVITSIGPVAQANAIVLQPNGGSWSPVSRSGHNDSLRLPGTTTTGPWTRRSVTVAQRLLDLGLGAEASALGGQS